MMPTVTRYVRYSKNGKASYGILEGEAVRELKTNFLHDITPTGTVTPLSEVRLLAPCEPSKVIAVGRNYKSHLGERTPTAYPTVFLKLPSCIIGNDDAIVIPPGATDVHYEAELVVVMGKTTSKVATEAVASHIFGVTAGNDISERVWQKNDVQWFRAKASDTFGPLGPAIVQGLDYNNLLLQSRVNGEVRQLQRTCDMLFDVATMLGMPRTKTDAGQTIGMWAGKGVEPENGGFYLVLPLAGPSNARDATGLMIDYAIDPFQILPIAFNWDWFYYSVPRYGLNVIDYRSRTMFALDDIEKNSVDYYAALRSAYTQQRADLIRTKREKTDSRGELERRDNLALVR